MRPIATTLSLALLALVSSAAQAQSMRPGLWQVEHRLAGNPEMEAAMAEARKQLAAMPPEQRKMMEDMMARQGASMSMSGADGGVNVKVCMTQDMVERAELPRQTEGECTHEVTSRSDTALSMRFACKNPESSGEGHYRFTSDTSYEMRMDIRSMHKGKPQSTTLQGRATWLGSDCGPLKPKP